MPEAVHQCEICYDAVPESEAVTETRMGHDGPVTLAFCPECQGGGR